MCVFYDSRCKRSTVRLVAAHANKERRRGTKKPDVSDFLAKLNYKHSFSSLGHARDNRSIIYFNNLRKPIEFYGRKKHPFTSYPAAKHPKCSKFTLITDMQEKPVDFFCCTTRASTLAPSIILPLRFVCKRFRSCSVCNSLIVG